MGVKINTTELKKILDITPSEQNIMLVGKHGIGKSQIIQEQILFLNRILNTDCISQSISVANRLAIPLLVKKQKI